VIADPLQCLCCQQDIEIPLICSDCSAHGILVSEMPLKQGMAEAIDLRVLVQNLLRMGQVACEKSLVNLFKHVAKQRGHLHQIVRVGRRKFFTPRLQLHYRAVGKVANSFQVGDELETCQQFTGLCLAYSGDGTGQLLINLAFDLVEFLFAVLDREERQPRLIADSISNIEDRITRNQAGAQYEAGEFVRSLNSKMGSPRRIAGQGSIRSSCVVAAFYAH